MGLKDSGLNDLGWHRLPSGLILQWGTATVNANSTVIINLPIAYPKAYRCFSSFANVFTSGGVPITSSENNLSQIFLGNANTAPHKINFLTVGY